MTEKIIIDEYIGGEARIVTDYSQVVQENIESAILKISDFTDAQYRKYGVRGSDISASLTPKTFRENIINSDHYGYFVTDSGFKRPFSLFSFGSPYGFKQSTLQSDSYIPFLMFALDSSGFAITLGDVKTSFLRNTLSFQKQYVPGLSNAAGNCPISYNLKRDAAGGVYLGKYSLPRGEEKDFSGEAYVLRNNTHNVALIAAFDEMFYNAVMGLNK